MSSPKDVHNCEVKEVPRSNVMWKGTPNLETHPESNAAEQEVEVVSDFDIASGHLVERSPMVKGSDVLMMMEGDLLRQRECGRNVSVVGETTQDPSRCASESWRFDKRCMFDPNPLRPSRCHTKRTSAFGGVSLHVEKDVTSLG